MNIEDLNKILKEKYNCRATDIFEFCNKEFAMGFEMLEDGINYRYFDLSKENIVEVTNKKLLDVFRKKNETHSDVEY